jgi:hypothetical protein
LDIDRLFGGARRRGRKEPENKFVADAQRFCVKKSDSTNGDVSNQDRSAAFAGPFHERKDARPPVERNPRMRTAIAPGPGSGRRRGVHAGEFCEKLPG